MAKNVTNHTPAADDATEPAVSAETGPLCSRCGKNPRRKDGSWCDGCRADQQASYRRMATDRAFTVGFAAGAEAMRVEILALFRGVNLAGMYRAGEVKRLIAETRLPGRQLPQETDAVSPVAT